jgi:hypothetical protein
MDNEYVLKETAGDNNVIKKEPERIQNTKTSRYK